MRVWKTIVRGLIVGVVSLALLYAVVGNLVLSTGVVRGLTNVAPDELTVDYHRAWTAWPGRVHVEDLTVRFQDANVQFYLQLDEARVDLALWSLARRKFHATRVRATGASWRMVLKTDDPVADAARLEAYPVIPGFARPPVRTAVVTPPPDPAALWTVQVDDVDATVREVWVMEFAWQGTGRVQGAFELQPLRHLWVRPALLALEPGTLSVGVTQVSTDFSMRADVDVAPYDIETHPALQVFRPLSASVQLQARLDDLSVAQRYLPQVVAAGRGRFDADLRLIAGKLGPATTFLLQLDSLQARHEEFIVDGVVTVRAALAPGTSKPTFTGEAGGMVHLELEGLPVNVLLNQVELDLVLSTQDLVDGVGLESASAHVIAARVDDARALRAAAARRVPLFLPAQLGDGPLQFSGTAYLTPAQTLVQLTDARLGSARLRGVALTDDEVWRAACAGHVGGLAFGARFESGALQVLPFVGPQWLGEEFARMKIDPHLAEPTPLAAFNLR
ncbi:MAG: hypothetical protein Q8L48_03010 [Archangium sp.]|nr:hypothetical protein [Archangium sp.]